MPTIDHEPGATETFPLRLAVPWRWALRWLLGVRPGAAQAALAPDLFSATFGRLGLTTPIENCCAYQLTGPYHWWKAIGPRGSLVDSGITFGTSAHGGVCVCFREPVAWRGLQVTALTVTVDDVDAMARALERRGIGGEDRRRR
jgi:hypothetical protein